MDKKDKLKIDKIVKDNKLLSITYKDKKVFLNFENNIIINIKPYCYGVDIEEYGVDLIPN